MQHEYKPQNFRTRKNVTLRKHARKEWERIFYIFSDGKKGEIGL